MKHDLNKAAAAYTKYVQAYGQEYMDIEIPCNAANFIPSLIEIAEKQQQEIEGLEKQADEMAEKHAEKDIIMGNMQQEIEQLKKTGSDLNNDLFHERTGKDRLTRKIEEQQQEIERLKEDCAYWKIKYRDYESN